MTTWQSLEEFKTEVNVDKFSETILYVSGIVLKLDDSVFSKPHDEINEPQYLAEAWRWQGIHEETAFFMDVAASDARRVTPYSFCLYFTNPFERRWHIVKHLKPVLNILGEIRIDHVRSNVDSPKFKLFREIPLYSGDTQALVLYRFNDQNEGMELCDYLKQEFCDSGIYMGQRII